MESGRTCNDQRAPKYLKLAIVLFGVLVLQACGQSGADVVAVAADSAVVEADVPVVEPTIEELLVGTQWDVVEMIGFPADNTVGNYVRFSSDDFGLFDGVGSSGAQIVWTDTGFLIGETDEEAIERGPRYLSRILHGDDSEIAASLDGQTLTLTRDELTVIAERHDAALAADSAVVEEVPEPTIEELLLDTDWEVVDSSGFPADSIIEGTFSFGKDQDGVDWFSYFNGANSGGITIAWSDTGFTALGYSESNDAEDTGYDMAAIVGLEGNQIVVTLDEQALTLVNDELTVVAEQR